MRSKPSQFEKESFQEDPTWDLLGKLPSASLPPCFAERLVRNLAETEVRNSSPKLLWSIPSLSRLLPLATAAAALVIGGLYFLHAPTALQPSSSHTSPALQTAVNLPISVDDFELVNNLDNLLVLEDSDQWSATSVF